MSLYELIRILGRRWKIVAFVGGAMMIIGLIAVSSMDDTSFTARSRIIVDQPQLIPEVGGVNVAPKIATLGPTLCALLGADDAVADIAAEAGTSTGAVGAVTCAPVEGTTLLDIRVSGPDADAALALAGAGAEVLAEQIADRYDGPEVQPRETVTAEVLGAARVREDPSDTRRRVLLVVVGSLLAAAALAVAAEPHRRDARPRAHLDPSESVPRPAS